MAEITVDTKQARREMFRVRGRFLKLQRTVIGDALEFASVPLVEAAKSNAPASSGLLKRRIQFFPAKQRRGLLTVAVGPSRFASRSWARNLAIRLSGGTVYRDPYYGKFQELGWWLTTHTPKGVRDLVEANKKLPKFERKKALTSLKASRRRIKFIPGKHFLKRAGETAFPRIQTIFAERVFRGLAEIQRSGESAGIV